MQEWAILIKNISNKKIIGIEIGRENRERERESTLNKDGKGGIEKADVEDWFSTNTCDGSEMACYLLLQTLVFATTLSSCKTREKFNFSQQG